MIADYFEMLLGDPVFIRGIGHVRSPKLKEIGPASELGYRGYLFFVNLLAWDKDKLLKYLEIAKLRGSRKLIFDEMSAFDIVSAIPDLRNEYQTIFQFFISEEVTWNQEHKCYLIRERGDGKKLVGVINQETFERARKAILQFNFIGIDEEDDNKLKFSDDKAKAAWEALQKELAEQACIEQKPKDNPNYHLGNIISKVCTVHPSYNLLNIQELTIFQLYDAFFQLGYLRSADLGQRIFSIHGGESFKFEDWMKPIYHNT